MKNLDLSNYNKSFLLKKGDLIQIKYNAKTKYSGHFGKIDQIIDDGYILKLDGIKKKIIMSVYQVIKQQKYI